MRRLHVFSTLAVLVIVAGGVLAAWWDLDLRWRPHAIVHDQAAIARSLAGSGWVSPHLSGPVLYVVAHRDCAPCGAFEERELEKLNAAGVDTRVIMVALADKNGQARSGPVERTTVAALWLDRDWGLLQRWLATPEGVWTAPGLVPADGDTARTAVIAAGRQTVADLRPLLRRNGVRMAYPVLVWWTKGGAMHACSCRRAQSWRRMERELGA
ncbi:MAG: hypothetical protein ABI376_00540 [Caulobacteraceae bacterium]